MTTPTEEDYEEMLANMSPFRWTVEITVDPAVVADGLDIRALQEREGQDFLLSHLGKIADGWRPEQMRARMVSGPSLKRVWKAQGYSDAEIEQRWQAEVMSLS